MARLPAQDRRRKILETALPRFARTGYRGTTTAMLAAASGVTEPILYRHFQGKLELFVVLVDQAADRLLEAAGQDVADDPRALFDRLAGGRRATDLRLMLCALGEAENEPAVKTAVRRFLRRLHRIVAKSLADEPARVQIETAIGRALTAPVTGRQSRSGGDRSTTGSTA